MFLPCLVLLGFVWSSGAAADVARCHACGPGVAGRDTPCGDTGCGPRYRGEIHEPSCPDPCDACNRWRGHHGGMQGPDMLAPWQLPPGRGFVWAADVGYQMPAPCASCGRPPLAR